MAEMKLGIRRQKTIKETTSGNCQDSLVPDSLNKSLEEKDVIVENEEMVLKEFSKELQSNVENSYEKKVSIDTDSQDYIFIKRDLMFDADSLTEHQKESLKQRKEDIAALYNDLSQSSSQDTQNLQEWVDKKSKSLGEAEKDHNKKGNISIRNILDDDANKENKIEMKELEAVKSVQKAKDNAHSNENLLIEDQMMTAKNTCDSTEQNTSADLMSRDLDANTQEKSLENKNDKSLSPSMLDSNSESETTDARQRGEVLLTDITNDSDRCKSVENDNAVTSVIAIDEANLSQRTRNKISRLHTNIVFDSSLSRSQRSKNCDDKKQPEENKGGNIAKRETKHRGRSIRKVEENTKEETAETEVNSKGRSHIQNDMEDDTRGNSKRSKYDDLLSTVYLVYDTLAHVKLINKYKNQKKKSPTQHKDVQLIWAHDPKLDSKIKGFVTEKLKRFHDNKGIAIAMYQCALKMQAMWRLLLERRKHHENTIETKQDQVQK
ncbi:telomere-associated protein RIF1-like [Bombus terrestris]|uniref:Telomere-associated protein RIF1-like n=1 Tax=Bombus terrestris TaxID=30195 RepID=A0A9C6SPP6_BOMTE|nr:telomere-associated protein RIF1-like [Bombus terrestris]